MTTVAPTPLTGPITTATVLGPQAARDSDMPDLGFHYVPLDYYASGLVVSNTTLTLTNGVAVGFSGSAWLWPQAGAAVVSEGLPHRMNHLAPLLQVQEQSSSAYASTAPTVLYL